MLNLTPEQAESLAPDAGTLSRARSIAKPGNYRNIGYSERAIWGVARGSSDYDSFVDLTGPAFKCSCPVKKLPCKHIMGLLLLISRQPELATHCDTPPDGLEEWLKKRDATTEAKITKAQNKKAEVKDTAAQAKRAEQRESYVQQGVEELKRFLEDIFNAGLLEASKRSGDSWEQMSRRLIDAQAKGLANQLNTIHRKLGVGPDWVADCLTDIGNLYILIRAWENREQLPPELVEDIRARIGWTRSKDDVLLLGAKQNDHWLVLNQFMSYESDIYSQNIWMIGRDSGQFAQILGFGSDHNTDGLTRGLTNGYQISGELAYYSRWHQQRAELATSSLLANNILADHSWLHQHAHACIRTAVSDLQTRRLRLPWASEWPLLLRDVRLVMKEDRLALVDQHQQLMLLDTNEVSTWQLLASMGKQPATLFGISHDGETLVPWGCLQNQHWTAFTFNREAQL